MNGPGYTPAVILNALTSAVPTLKIDKFRRDAPRVIRELQVMVFKSPVLCKSADDLKEQYRAQLKMLIPAKQPTTIRNKVQILSRLMEAACAYGQLTDFDFDPAFLSFTKFSDSSDERRHEAYRRFMGWCKRRRIAFRQIVSETFSLYNLELLSGMEAESAQKTYCDLRRFWQENLATDCPVNIPFFSESRRTRYGLRVTDWPVEWQQLWERFLASARQLPGTEDEDWPHGLEENTIQNYKRDLSLLLGWMVLEGMNLRINPPAAVFASSMLPLTMVTWHINQKCGGVPREYHSAMLARYALLAEHLVSNLPTAIGLRSAGASIEAQPVSQRPWYDDLQYTELVANCLREIASVRTAWAALDVTTAKQERLKLVRRFRDALILSFLLLRPLRSANVRSLRFLRQLTIRKDGSWWISLMAEETKGNKPWQGAFPTVLVEEFQFYFAEMLPLVSSGQFPLLFPTMRGAQASGKTFCRIVKKAAKQVLGINASVHTFRRIVVSLYLMQYPTELVTMRNLLGHAYVEITRKHYHWITGLSASRRLGQFALESNSHARMAAAWRPAPSLWSIVTVESPRSACEVNSVSAATVAA